MAELFLHGANVGAALEQMGRKGVAQRVTARGLRDTCAAYGCLYGALHGTLVEMMASPDPGARIHARAVSDKDVLPAPFGRCVRILPGERVRQIDGADACFSVALEQRATRGEMSLQGVDQLVG